MARFIKSRSKAQGAPAGSYIFIGNQKVENTRIRLISYNQEEVIEKEYKGIEDVFNDIHPGYVNWLNIDGLHDISIIKKIGTQFNLSPLALESVLNTGQRVRFLEDKESVTWITKAIYFDPEEIKISVEQISFILRNHLLISFQEKAGDHFEFVRERIRNATGRIRTASEDYLLHALTDSLVDNYLIDIEKLGSLIEAFEPKLSGHDKMISERLFHFKTELAFIRKTIRPQKEVLTRILRSNTGLIRPETMVYYQELNDLTEHANDAVDIYFAMVADQLNIYNTNINNRVNDVMKVLTIFAAIFIPLTFIAGIYGTNFKYLPEFQYKYSYFVMLGVMGLIAGIMIIYFKRKKWF